MRIVDFAKMLQGSINEKIKDCKDSIHQAHNPIYNKSLEVEIEHTRMGSRSNTISSH